MDKDTMYLAIALISALVLGMGWFWFRWLPRDEARCRKIMRGER